MKGEIAEKTDHPKIPLFDYLQLLQPIPYPFSSVAKPDISNRTVTNLHMLTTVNGDIQPKKGDRDCPS